MMYLLGSKLMDVRKTFFFNPLLKSINLSGISAKILLWISGELE